MSAQLVEPEITLPSDPAQLPHAATSEEFWVSGENYLTGQVVGLGGDAPVVQLVPLGKPKPVQIAATAEQLVGVPYLYRKLTVLVSAEQNVETGELRNLRLLEFVPPTHEVNEEALAHLRERGQRAWADVEDATAWVEALRGH